MKRILITGANSYIGMSFERWMSQYSHNYVIDTLDMRDPSWQDKDLSLFFMLQELPMQMYPKYLIKQSNYIMMLTPI